MVPRFRQRVVEPTTPVAPPAWGLDPHFDLDYHLRRVRLPAPGSMADLLRLAESIGITPLDRSRPLWVGTLVDGLAGGRAAYVLRLHHCLMDRFGTMQLFKACTARGASRRPTSRSLSRSVQTIATPLDLR
jgi:diacylglycerol O-acyltransferase